MKLKVTIYAHMNEGILYRLRKHKLQNYAFKLLSFFEFFESFYGREFEFHLRIVGYKGYAPLTRYCLR